MINRIFAAMLLMFMPIIAIAQESAEAGEAVQQVRYWEQIGIAVRDLIFIVMFIAGIVIFFISVIILVKDYVMADAQRGDKKFSIGELALGVVLAGALMSPFGLLTVGADAAGGAESETGINPELFNEAKESQNTGNGT